MQKLQEIIHSNLESNDTLSNKKLELTLLSSCKSIKSATKLPKQVLKDTNTKKITYFPKLNLKTEFHYLELRQLSKTTLKS